MDVELDAMDLRILMALQRKGRITNAELSEQVNLSPSACHRRVQRLESEGIIAEYVALLDPRRTEDFARIHRQYLSRLPGVAQMQSSFALRTVFKTTAIDL